MFKRGYKAVEEEVERSAQAQEMAGKKLFRFYMKADPKGKPVRAEVRFLTEEPITFYEHTVQKMGKWNNIICIDEDCSECEKGNKPQFKGAYLVYDYRTYIDKDGNEQESGLRLFVMGQRVLTQLDRISTKYGLTNRNVEIERSGTGQKTTYNIDRGDEEELTKEEIFAMIPEKLEDQYDGSTESLMVMVENQLKLQIGEISEDDDEDDEPVNKNIIGVDDDDEEPPKKKTLFNNKKKIKENSVKKKSSIKSQIKKKKEGTN